MKKLSFTLAAMTATPAMASSGPFFSLHNTDFVVSVAFILFVAILLIAKVPAKIAGMLDGRAATIKAELEEAKALRDEARALLASYEKKHKEVQDQADRIVASAKEEAGIAAQKAKDDLKLSIARRLAAAQDQIASAETAAVRKVREHAVDVAVAAASTVLAKQKTAASAAASIDEAIAQVDAKLH
jgi:F-type H+-transporting ATPase subunit b